MHHGITKYKLNEHSDSKIFCSVFFEKKKKLTNLKTNFIKFELSMIFRSQDITDLTSEILPELPIRNKSSQSYCMLLILNKCLSAELLSKQSKGSKL